MHEFISFSYNILITIDIYKHIVNIYTSLSVLLINIINEFKKKKVMLIKKHQHFILLQIYICIEIWFLFTYSYMTSITIIDYK